MDLTTITIRLIMWAAIAGFVHAFGNKRLDWPTSIFIGFIVVAALSGYSASPPSRRTDP